MEHLYVPFVQIKYILGTGAIPFDECVTFFIVYPKTDGVPLTQSAIYRPVVGPTADTQPTLWRGEEKGSRFIGTERKRGRESEDRGGKREDRLTDEETE
jgi:hypothetical protein